MTKNTAIKTTILASLILPNFAWAQLVYEPAAGASTAVPTLTTTALIVAILLMLIAAKWAGFNRNKAFGKIVGVLGVCAIASGAVSVKLITDAHAGGGGSGEALGYLSSANGGSIPIDSNSFNLFENTSGVNQRIASIDVEQQCTNYDRGLVNDVERCEVGNVITTDQDGLCYIECREM